MKCPFCGFEETQVKDSRTSEDGTFIKRRRLCPECGSRFSTVERLLLKEMTVIKKNGNEEPFDREKIKRSIRLAMHKRSLKEERLEKIVTAIQRQLELEGENIFPSSKLGELVLENLMAVDKVAYIRYASVYKNFENTEDFQDFLNHLIEWHQRENMAKESLPETEKEEKNDIYRQNLLTEKESEGTTIPKKKTPHKTLPVDKKNEDVEPLLKF